MDFLKELGIEEVNYGSCVGAEGWIQTTEGGKIDSINPFTGEVIASVYQATVEDYEKIITASKQVFERWKKVPAPKRGQLVREMADALREKKDALGSLVSLEMGKIKQEGDGEGTGNDRYCPILPWVSPECFMVKQCIRNGTTTGCTSNGIPWVPLVSYPLLISR